MKFKDLATRFSTRLNSLYGEKECEALLIMALQHLLNLKYGAYLLKKEEMVPANDLVQLEKLLDELATGKPIQYVFGEAHFYGLTFKVNSAVLIPRPETEELVDWIIKSVGSLQLAVRNSRLLDVGTGSGCIAIALKKHLPKYNVTAIDIATDTLAVAEENAKLNQVEVEFIKQDILQIPYSKLQTRYTIIVSNPPYITQTEKEHMHTNVLDNEPHRALFVSNEEPLIFYEAIADFALQNLESRGLLFFEINENLGKDTIYLLDNKGFIDIELRKDMQGKDRMVRCEKA